jgi:hypothetical protein
VSAVQKNLTNKILFTQKVANKIHRRDGRERLKKCSSAKRKNL